MRALTPTRANSVCIIVLASAVLAGQAASEPSQDQIAAIKSSCRSDYMSYCSGVPRGGSQALQCLKSNLAKLSSACQQAVKAATATAAAPSTGAPATVAKPAAAAAESVPASSAAVQPAPTALVSSAATQAGASAPPTSASSGSASSASDAAAKAATPAKSAKKASSSTTKAAGQPTPAAGSNETAPPAAAVKKPPTVVAAVPAVPAPTTAAAPPAASPQLGFIPPRKKLMLARSCRDDFRAYCPGVDLGAGRAITCLSENIGQLTPVCRDTLAKLAR